MRESFMRHAVWSRHNGVAVVGATGMVGRCLLALLHKRGVPAASVRAFASARSAGTTVAFGPDQLPVQEVKPGAFVGVRFAFFAVNAAVARSLCPQAVREGAVCLDKSSAHRLLPDVPLVVPQINAERLAGYRARGIVASPNCVAIPVTRVLAVLRQGAPLQRVVACTYQAASGAGDAGVRRLQQALCDFAATPSIDMDVAGGGPRGSSQTKGDAVPLPGIPEGEPFLPHGRSEEEEKVVRECRRVLEAPELPMEATCVRVPVFHGHAVALHAAFDGPLSVERARGLLAEAEGVKLVDEGRLGPYPTSVDVTGTDMVAVGRVRRDRSVAHGLALWVCSDNVCVGAALNAVRTAEILYERYWER